MFGDLDWPLNALRGFVSISWASCNCYRQKFTATFVRTMHRVYNVKWPRNSSGLWVGELSTCLTRSRMSCGMPARIAVYRAWLLLVTPSISWYRYTKSPSSSIVSMVCTEKQQHSFNGLTYSSTASRVSLGTRRFWILLQQELMQEPKRGNGGGATWNCKGMVTTTIRLRFDCDLSAVRLPLDRAKTTRWPRLYSRRPTCVRGHRGVA